MLISYILKYVPILLSHWRIMDINTIQQYNSSMNNLNPQPSLSQSEQNPIQVLQMIENQQQHILNQPQQIISQPQVENSLNNLKLQEKIPAESYNLPAFNRNAQGFGTMYFNMRDPNFGKTNQPIKVGSSWHVTLLIVSLLFFAGIIVGGIGYTTFLKQNIGKVIGVILGTYALYLILALCCSNIRGYISNLKKFQKYKQTYDKMVAAKGFFVFQIECYHYELRSSGSGTYRQRVVTHSVEKTYHPSQCIDESGQILGIQDTTKYVFIQYLKRFYFTNQKSENRFISAYNRFVSRNTSDQFQSHSHTFEIERFQEEVGFTAMGSGGHHVALFYVFTLLGMGVFYAYFMEIYISRYEVGILKRLSF